MTPGGPTLSEKDADRSPALLSPDCVQSDADSTLNVEAWEACRAGNHYSKKQTLGREAIHGVNNSRGDNNSFLPRFPLRS